MDLRRVPVRDAGGLAPARHGLRGLPQTAPRRGLLLALSACALFLAAAAQAELAVTRHAFARAVEAREPLGAAQSFPADVGRLFFFTQVSGAAATGGEIRHVWIYDGREVADVALPVEGPTWRTWSSKQILPQFRGDWSVEVRDGAGRVLLADTCRVE